MKLRPLFIVIICAGMACADRPQAQETLAGYTQARRFAPSNAEQFLFSYTLRPQYFKRGVKFWYEYKTANGKAWYVVDPEAGKKWPLFDADELAAQLTGIVKDPFVAQHLPVENLRLEEDDATFHFEVRAAAGNTFYFAYNYVTRALSEREKDVLPRDRWGNVAPDKRFVVFAKNLNLYCASHADYEKLLRNPNDSSAVETALTTDGVAHFGFGMPRNRMNTDSTPADGRRRQVQGYWSPDGRYFAAVLTDQRCVKDLWVIHSAARPRPTLETYKYQLPGETEAPVYHLYIFDLVNRTRTEVRTEAFADQTVAVSSRPKHHPDDPQVWLGDATRCFLTRTSRDMKRVDICAYTVGEDSARTLICERMNTYIETRPLALTANSDLIHWSERDGWAHLYLYDAGGRLKRQITKGAWHVDQIRHVDEAGRVIYFVANGMEKDDATPYYEHLYRVNFDGSGLKAVTPGNYHHLTHMDRYGRYVVDNYSRINTIPATALFDNQGRRIMTLEVSDFSQLMQAGYRFPEMFTVKAADGVTDLYGIIYKPFDFDSTRTYPVIDYVYPGPQQEGTYTRYIPLNPRTDRLAQAGFIVVSVGQRGGHPGRSKWYHNYGYGNLRDYPLADHKAAIEQLCLRHAYMDIHRVGIHGHSGGGFMSTAAMLQYPDFFKVAVSCAGNHDNNIYNRAWSEKHHGVTETTEDDGTMRFDIRVPANHELVANLKGHLLLIHGEIDNNVHPANTMRMVDALIRAGKRFDMLLIPNQRHHFENYNEYFYWRMVDYFSEHLLGERERRVDIKDFRLGNFFQGYQND